jgi:hypothetical protein
VIRAAFATVVVGMTVWFAVWFFVLPYECEPGCDGRHSLYGEMTRHPEYYECHGHFLWFETDCRPGGLSPWS